MIIYKDKHTRFSAERMEAYENRDRCPLEGDLPVLQLINTIKRRETAAQKDYLNNYDDFLNWAYDAGVVNADGFKSLCFYSYCEVLEVDAIFDKVISLRECLYGLFTALMEGVPPHQQYLTLINQVNDEANANRRLIMNRYGMDAEWVNPVKEMAYPLWKIALSAIKLLILTDDALIKKCSCGNLFLDRSKKSNRRWCSPLTCGRAYWGKEYYRRKKVNGA